MPNTDSRVDAYIEKAPAYSRPILEKLRRAFHRADPRIEETIKWGTPSFEHKGMVVGMAAFRKHVAFGFWKARAMKDPEGLFHGDAKQSPFAVKVTSLKELPPVRVIVDYVKEAVELNEGGVKASPSAGRKKAGKKPPVRVPADFARALAKNRNARATFDDFPPSHRREYVEWITEAKREATREKRIATAVAWLAEGKPRNWRYRKRR